MKLKSKTAVITGGARGIGKAIASLFACEGANIVLADVDFDAVQQTSTEIGGLGGKCVAMSCDVSKYDDNQNLAHKATEIFGALDILVCNAGIVRSACPIEDITPATWEKVLGVNLMGSVYATQAAIPHFKRQKRGSIVYMASVGGEVGGVASEATYSVSKAAVLCLTKAVAKQLAPFNVRVNAIAPGAVHTAMTDILQYDDAVINSIPLKKLGNVKDIAAAALFLSSEDANYITGTTLDVNGGMYMR